MRQRGARRAPTCTASQDPAWKMLSPPPRRLLISVAHHDHRTQNVVLCIRGRLPTGTGGYPALAWKFIASKGVVSAACMPYNLTKSLLCPLPACEPPTDHTAFKAKDVKMVYGGA